MNLLRDGKALKKFIGDLSSNGNRLTISVSEEITEYANEISGNVRLQEAADYLKGVIKQEKPEIS